MKYSMDLYGWDVETTAHSITDEQVSSIQELMELNGYEELWEVRHDLEDEGVIDDLYNPDICHLTRPSDNGSLWGLIYDEQGNEVLKFDITDIKDIYESLGDDVADTIPFEGYNLIPELRNDPTPRNILATFDENKGGIANYVFESDVVPTKEDISYQSGDVATPNGDWDFISKFFFKGEELEVVDYLDNRGKSSSVEIYLKNGDTIE